MKTIVPYLLCLLSFIPASITQDLWKKPFIRYEPQDVTVSSGEEIRLSCGVMGYPKPKVTWFKDTVPLISLEPRVILADDTLLIRKARHSEVANDAGLYYCIAKNPHGTFKSRNATVVIHYIQDKFKVDPKSVVLEKGSDHTIECQPPDGVPKPSVEWYKDNKLVQLIQKRLESSKKKDMHQLNFFKIDPHFMGSYQCQASNKEGVIWSKKAQVDLKPEKPVVLVVRDVVDVVVGDEAGMSCISESVPTPNITWDKVNDTLPAENRRDQILGKIIIKKTEFKDAGTYNCTATNAIGKGFGIAKLNVYSKVEFTLQPIDTVVGIGQRVEFPCRARGGKSPDLFWEYQNTRYRRGMSTNEPVHVTNENTLVISKTNLVSGGTIHCRVKDLNKEINAKVTLTVLDSTVDPPSLTLTPSKTVVNEGSNLILTCKVDGPGVSKFEWSLADTNKPLYDSTEGVRITTFSNGQQLQQLTLKNLKLHDSRFYRCLVRGDGGTSNQVSNVTIISVAVPPQPVKELIAVDIKSRSVKLIWTAPPVLTVAPVTSYDITAKVIKTKATFLIPDVSSKETEKVITGLIPSTSYVFTIVAKNRIGKSNPTESADVVTLESSDPSIDGITNDKLENVALRLTVGTVTYDSIELMWNNVDPLRITRYIISWKKVGDSVKDIETVINDPKTHSYVLSNLMSNTKYQFSLRAANKEYRSQESPIIQVQTILKGAGGASLQIGLQKIDNENLLVNWSPPPPNALNGITAYQITTLNADRTEFDRYKVKPHAKKFIISGLDAKSDYIVFVVVVTDKGPGIKSREYSVKLSTMRDDEVMGYVNGNSDKPPTQEDGESGILKIVKEPWFIATVGILVWLALLAVVICICCRRRKKKSKESKVDEYRSTRGLLPHGNNDYPNTSLSRNRWNGVSDTYGTRDKKQRRSCCKSQTSSLDDDDEFSNRVNAKPLMTYTRHNESIEMKAKASNGDFSYQKENNLGMTMKNGCMVDAPLNNAVDLRYPDFATGTNRFYDSLEDRQAPPRYEESIAPGSGRLSRETKFQSDSVERRHAEIVRTTTKSFPETNVNNVLETNQQATWKREKVQDSSKENKPPGENTLRRQGKSQFKPLPKLEVLNWADGLPNSSRATSVNGEHSPKSSSVISDGNDMRTDSRASHGGSSNSLNKYPRRRRNSNASSMMSSELYQSELDPSGYSDIYPSERKKKKEKAAPPPIDLDGLTSDILLQWAESVTNSSPSSSGSSSPSRLSGISSEGSIYTDEDFAQAVAAVVECQGFNMEYDYSIPGMPGTQQPLSATRNSKMNKIDQVFAQRSKRNNTSTPSNSKRQDTQSPSHGPLPPQLSMSNYLTGSQKASSSHSGSSGIPRSTRSKSSTLNERNRRYGTGFDDVGSVSGAKPLTMSNLMKHDSSLDRDNKREAAKPLTSSNLRHHETSLERTRNAPPSYDKIERESLRNINSQSRSNPQLLPETALSVTSALERNESMNSKDSMNSSSRQDSEVENLTGTSERKPKSKKLYLNSQNATSSSISTVRSNGDTEC